MHLVFGYALGFEYLMKIIETLLPSREVISGALRENKTAYPLIAIREIIANALIHQEFTFRGTGPVIELFPNRIEVTNPGQPLVDIYRIIDNPPRSRNERLAALMRRLKMCEELGTGWDKIVIQCELFQLPAPRISLYDENTKVTLYSKKLFSDLTLDDRLWSCYLHACIKYIEGDYLTNSSLRKRFGVSSSSSSSISRVIKASIDKGYIKPLDPDTAPKHMKYVPTWA
ncbi:ATP-binding protein [Peptococcus niger]|uniref:Putative ATP-dependent DNA helicase recG C-terminal n=1 Tax=Peptococcus niger TaxID=2741 RepID=A0A1G6TQJ1_PEPNI|nr:ATP-binding protein [Peptococcus niger]SDD31320.1 Putative ATP-dependent DNA helicase recG C-terminal [Peptococcus niger]